MESRGCQTDKIQHRGPGPASGRVPAHPSARPLEQDEPCPSKTDVVPTFHPISKHLNRTFSQKLIRRRRKVGRTLKCLWVFTPLSCLFALSSFTSSVISSDWLRTEEKMPNLNRTILFGPNKSPEYLPKFTTSGLFELCFTQPGKYNFSCLSIDYFPKESYQPDQNDSTMSIPYAVIHAAWFFFGAGLLMSVAGLLCLVGHCLRKWKILTFVAGVVFIFAGLSLFIGQVVYIAILKAEVGSKLVPISLLSPPRLTYQYGWSFLLLVISFLSCEAAGVSSIFLYMHHHQYRYLCRQDESRIGVHLLKNLAAPLTGADQLTTNGDIIREAINKAEDELEQQEEHEDTRDMSRFMDHKHIPTMTVAEANKRRDSAENNPVWAVGNGRLKGAQGATKSLAVVDPFQAGVFPPEKTTRLVSHPWNQAHFHPRLNGQLKSSSGSPPKRRADMFLCARHRAASLRRHNRRVDHESNLFECQVLPKQSRHHHPSHPAAQYPRISDGNSSQEDDEDEDDRSEITADGDDEDSFRALLHQERRNNGMLSADRHQPNSHVLSSRNPPHITMDSFTNPSFFQPHFDSSRAHSAPSPFCPASHHHPTLPNSVPRPATVAEGLPEFHQCCQCVHCGFTLTNEGPSSSKSHHAAGCRGVSVGVGVGGPDPDSFLSRASVMHSLVGPRKCLCEDSAHHSTSVTSHHNLMPSPPLPHYPSDCGLYETGVGDPFFLDQDTRV